jgi:hypothetical protein
MENNQNQQTVPPVIDHKKADKNNEEYVTLLVDNIPYRVEFEPFFINDQVRYYVTINAGPKDVFVLDKTLIRFRAIDDRVSTLPVALEIAIGAELQHQNL